jgi:hypothetical protein
MEMSMRYLLTAATLAVTLAMPFAGSANAQNPSNDVMTRCNQAVGQMKFEGWPGDRNREMMMLACQSHGGAIPGAQNQVEQKPVALPRQAPVRKHTAPRS